MHPERVPPARPFDLAAATRAAGAELGELGAWIAGCTGSAPPLVVVRTVVAGEGEAARPTAPDRGSGAPAPAPVGGSATQPGGVIRLPAGGVLPTVGHVAAAVDAGRALAAQAARDGVTVLVVCGAGDGAAPGRVAAWLEDRAAASGVRGPLGALWRLGSDDLARLCGVALGSGEAGLALVYGGPAGTAACGLAVAVQPALAPRVREGFGVLAGAAAGSGSA